MYVARSCYIDKHRSTDANNITQDTNSNIFSSPGHTRYTRQFPLRFTGQTY